MTPYIASAVLFVVVILALAVSSARHRRRMKAQMEAFEAEILEAASIADRRYEKRYGSKSEIIQRTFPGLKQVSK
jgi:hypothetical protein